MDTESKKTEIERRLGRLYAAAGAAFDLDISKCKPIVHKESQIYSVYQDFRGGKSDAELENEVGGLLFHIAHLQEHLLRWARKTGADKSKITGLFSSSLELRICKDLFDCDKHAEDRRDGGLSKVAPRLGAIRRSLQLTASAGEAAHLSFAIGPNGPVMQFGGAGRARVVLDAPILDKSGKQIGSLSALFEASLKQLEQLVADLKLSGH